MKSMSFHTIKLKDIESEIAETGEPFYTPTFIIFLTQFSKKAHCQTLN